MKKIEELVKMGICVLSPTYQKNVGNVTKIITRDGEIFIDQRTTKTVLKRIAKYYTIHLKSCRSKYGEMLHQRFNIPILLNKKLLLIPLKMRKPKFKKDGAKGYINLYDIEKVTEKEKNIIIQLKNNIEVITLTRMKTVQDQINKAKLISGVISLNSKDEQSYPSTDFYAEYKSPATKGDIAKLQEEFEKLKGVVEKSFILQKQQKMEEIN